MVLGKISPVLRAGFTLAKDKRIIDNMFNLVYSVPWQGEKGSALYEPNGT